MKENKVTPNEMKQEQILQEKARSAEKCTPTLRQTAT